MSPKEILFYTLRDIAQKEGVELKAEVTFHPVRRWRFDWAIPAYKIAIEYDGHHESGARSRARAGLKPLDKSGHSTLAGLTGDHEKTNAAQIQGWLVLRFTAPFMNEDGRKKHKLTGPGATLQEAIDARKATW